MSDPSVPKLARRRFALSGLALGATALAARGARAADAPASAPKAIMPVSLAGVSPRLTIHTIDTYHGSPAAGLRVDFSMHDGKDYKLVKTLTIGPNGRAIDDPVLVGDTYRPGQYQFLLHVDDYYAMKKAQLPTPPFLGKVPVNFQVVNANDRIHLPIQFGPWSYNYSRGS
ncbi:MAG: hydroxyisourate hydrolase [Proteobacteria bacterium]|nr:hydroxyisourate hydrolase [Pseudomonadota bacterium]